MTRIVGRIVSWNLNLAVVMVALCTMAAPPAAHAQIPDEFKNLKVLDTNISKGDLMETMKGFSFALDVRCQHCHVGEEGIPFSEFDFVSDAKSTKTTARTMMRMVAAIDSEHISKVKSESGERFDVACITCHRGQKHPEDIQSILQKEYDRAGAEAAGVKYRALRKDFYGAGAYDFREQTLNSLAIDMVSSGQYDDAVGILKINAEFHPKSDEIPLLMGFSRMRQGDMDAARASFEQVLKLNPENQDAKSQLERLEGK